MCEDRERSQGEEEEEDEGGSVFSVEDQISERAERPRKSDSESSSISEAKWSGTRNDLERMRIKVRSGW